MLPLPHLMPTSENTSLLAFGGLGIGEMLVIGVIAVILFGQRLPEVARSLGKSYTQFRRGLHDMQSEISAHTYYNPASQTPASNSDVVDDDMREMPTAPKFVPPSEEPQVKEETG